MKTETLLEFNVNLSYWAECIESKHHIIIQLKKSMSELRAERYGLDESRYNVKIKQLEAEIEQLKKQYLDNLNKFVLNEM